MTQPLLNQEFDPVLWEGGVDDGAFSGERDSDSVWYTLKVGEDKVALASAVPGPGVLTTVSYYVHPDHRGQGYGTKIASRVTDLHEKATFTIFKDNEASIKVAISALRNKFSMTLGHNVVRLTKEAAEGMKDSEARELLKSAVSQRYVMRGIQSRIMADPKVGVRSRHKSRQAQDRAIGVAAQQVRKASPGELRKSPELRSHLKRQVRGVQGLYPKTLNVPHRESVARRLGRALEAQSPQEQLF
jgi:GNAT superfamily N-acetyltransferase